MAGINFNPRPINWNGKETQGANNKPLNFDKSNIDKSKLESFLEEYNRPKQNAGEKIGSDIDKSKFDNLG